MKKVLKHLLWIIPAIIVILVASLATYASIARSRDSDYHAKLQKNVQVSSKSFQNNQEMPVVFSCKGNATAPAIQWTKPADGTKSYALITMDWDAPSPSLRLFPITHWVLYNIPADMSEIPEGSTNADLTQRKIVPGLNIAGQPGYAAPCPPMGTHHYEFRIYALDTDQLQPASNDRAGVLKSMEGHVLGYGELVGLKSP